MTNEELRAALFRWRGLEQDDVCPKCGGRGSIMYGSTSTWHGGIGGCACTEDVCDSCWGSGSKSKPWANLRRMKNEKEAEIARRSTSLIADRIGCVLSCCQPAIRELASELQRMSRGRKQRPSWFYECCEVLARTLNEGVDAERLREQVQKEHNQ